MLVSIDVGIKNMAVCVIENNTIIAWKIINISYGPSICKSIIDEFDDLYDTIKGSDIVIERQMTKKMCNIQCYLEMYFRMKGFSSVVIYSPKHKLSGSGKENSGKGKNKYNDRKNAAISLCSDWLKSNPQSDEITDIWEKTKKKDDIADTLMMAIAYYEKPVKDCLTIKKKIVARKPTAKQLKGKYSKSNIKYLLQQTPCNERQESKITKKLQQCILKFWKTFDDCLYELGLCTDTA